MKKKKKLRLKRPFQLILAALLFLLAFSFFQLIKNQFKQENPLVSTQVLNYEDLMLKYARENDIEEYLPKDSRIITSDDDARIRGAGK